jgi:hypothetical protein
MHPIELPLICCESRFVVYYLSPSKLPNEKVGWQIPPAANDVNQSTTRPKHHIPKLSTRKIRQVENGCQAEIGRVEILVERAAWLGTSPSQMLSLRHV